MDRAVKNNLSHICLISLFFIGNAVINLPFSENLGGALIGFFASLLIALPLIIRFSSINIKTEKTPLNIAFSLLFVLYSLFCGIVTLRNYVTFSDKIILPEIGSFFPTLLFLFLILLICREQKKVLLKLSLISGISVFAVVIILFLLSLDSMSLKALIPKKIPTLKEIGYQTLSFFGMSFAEGIVLVGFLKSKTKKEMLGGFFTGAAVLLIILVQCLSVFGYTLLIGLNYPYASVMSVITFGDKFSRMEGFSYLLYFSCTLIKTCVCVISARDILASLFPKTKKYFLPTVLITYGALCVFTDFFRNLPFIYVAPFLIIPPVLLAVFREKGKGSREE